MESSVSIKSPPVNPLYDFASYICRYSSHDQIRDPEYLAREFRRYFGIKGNLKKSEFIDIAIRKLGTVSYTHLTLPTN